MPKFSELMSGVLDAVREEKPNTDSIKVTLKDIEGLHNETLDNLSYVNKESKTRKERIRDELLPKISSLEDQVEELTKKGDTTEIQRELDSLRVFKTKVFKGQRETFTKSFDKIIEHPNFEKAKSKFKFEIGDDKKVDYTNISDEDMETNISALNELNELEYFKVSEEQTRQTYGKKFKGVSNEKEPKIKNTADLGDFMREQLEQEIID